MRDLASRFQTLFDGNMRVHGTYDLSRATSTDEGKTEGAAKTKRTAPTLALWESHLAGEIGLGIVPIRDDQTVSFGAIDVDSYDGLNHADIAARIKKLRLPLMVCRSKSGGAHVYCFSMSPVTADRMQTKLREAASFLGFGGSEIFPKQKKILAEQGDVGSWINMPYFNGMMGLRYAVRDNGEAFTPEEFIAAANESRATDDFFTKPLIKSDCEFKDGPPCLAALSTQGFPEGTRNNSLMAICVYLRKKFPDDWETRVDDLNRRMMDPPLQSDEVQSVVKSMSRKDYNYSCSTQPIVSACNAGLCRTKKYGVGKSSATLPEFGSLTKLETDPPIFFWTIDGVRVELTTPQIQDQRLLQRRVMEEANLIVPSVSRPVWEETLKEAFSTITVVETTIDVTPRGQFLELLEKFCHGRAQANSLAEITMGRPFTAEGRVFFRMHDLLRFLSAQKFTDFGKNKITVVLREFCKHHAKIIEGRTVNFWSVPVFRGDRGQLPLPESITGEEAPF